MSRYQWFRFGCLAALWLALSWLVASSQPLTPRVVFFIVASGIIVFVPLYKKYRKQQQADEQSKK